MSAALKLAPTDQDLWFINGRVRVALAKAENADGITVLEHWMPFGDAPPLHIHHNEDEVFILLEGEMTFEVSGQKRYGRAGDTVCAPKGLPHRYRVTSPQGARAYTITCGGFEDMVRSMSRPSKQLGLPPFTIPDASMQQSLAEACKRHQIEIIGPPLDPQL